MHWRHVSITTTPCWGSRLVALRTCCAGRARWRSASQSVHGPGPVQRYGMPGLARWLHAWRWRTWQCPRLTPNTRGRPSVTSYAYGLLWYSCGNPATNLPRCRSQICWRGIWAVTHHTFLEAPDKWAWWQPDHSPLCSPVPPGDRPGPRCHSRCPGCPAGSLHSWCWWPDPGLASALILGYSNSSTTGICATSIIMIMLPGEHSNMHMC